MNSIMKTKDDVIYNAVVLTVVTVLLLLVLYPIIYVVSASFSSANAVTTGKVVFLPVDFSIEGYKAVFENKDVLTGYKNTVIYTVLGTLVNVVVTLVAAYPLSRKDFIGRRQISFIFTFTMLFGGGMIPTYILMRDLHLINTMWVMILPGAVTVYNLMVTRTFIESNIPGELLEATQVDGCSDARYFVSFVLPLSKPVIAVITLFYAVGHWNSYFSAFLYLNDRKLFPLQLFLREILINNKIDASTVMDQEILNARQGLADLLKYSLIIVSTLPIMCLYPFIQKYFVKGVMIGSVKG